MVTLNSKFASFAGVFLALVTLTEAQGAQNTRGAQDIQKSFYETMISYAKSEEPKLFGQCAILTWVQKAKLKEVDKEIESIQREQFRDMDALAAAREKRQSIATEHDKWLTGNAGYGIEKLFKVKKVPSRHGFSDQSVIQISKASWIKLFNLLSENCVAKSAEGNSVEVVSQSGETTSVALSTTGYSILQPFLPMEENENKALFLILHAADGGYTSSLDVKLGQRKGDPANLWRFRQDFAAMRIHGCNYKREVQF